MQAEVLRDEIRGVGPLLATGRGLRAAADAGSELAFVCAVDMPFMSAELIDELAECAARLGVDVVLPWDGRDHYLAGVYRTALADRVDALVAAGERSMRALVDYRRHATHRDGRAALADEREHHRRPVLNRR